MGYRVLRSTSQEPLNVSAQIILANAYRFSEGRYQQVQLLIRSSL